MVLDVNQTPPLIDRSVMIHIQHEYAKRNAKSTTENTTIQQRSVVTKHIVHWNISVENLGKCQYYHEKSN